MYTPLFQQYCELLETTLDTKLKAQVPGFSMAEFSAMLTDRQDELMSEVRSNPPERNPHAVTSIAACCYKCCQAYFTAHNNVC